MIGRGGARASLPAIREWRPETAALHAGKAACLHAVVLLFLVPHPAPAQVVRVEARFVPEEGRIADAAVMANGHLALLYPDEGRIADYTPDGRLFQHIVSESGAQHRFRPTACIAGPGEMLYVFDEAAHAVFNITPDGNMTRGVGLAYPDSGGGGTLALSRVGGLAYGRDTLWAMLPERGVLAGFDDEGALDELLDLGALLPFANAVYTRAQFLPDGWLYFLDYHQGAVIYRRGQDGNFKRLRPAGTPDSFLNAATVQDFAVDSQRNILLATHDEANPLMLLVPGEQGYESHPLELELPDGAHRLACRHSRGKYIVWLRDEPLVLVLQLQ
ncbi:hypothetical protein IIA79_05270 [bacterium]|nr:hypothetical protein [bacterium]